MYVDFTVVECLTAQSLSKVDRIFHLHEGSSDEVRLLRLMSGVADVLVTRTGSTYPIRENNLVFPSVVHSKARALSFQTCLSPDCTRTDLAAYYKKTKQSNRELFRLLVAEYCHFSVSTILGNHTRAFLHVYRILELISYMFPLIHASQSSSYYGTYTQLKAFFADKKDAGELLFFKTFLQQIMGANGYLGFGLLLEFTGVSPDVNRRYIKIVKELLDSNDIIRVTDPTQIELVIDALIGLIIDVRNRWFHFAIGGRRNLSSFDMPEPDDFFAPLNKAAMNWISVIYLEVLQVSVEHRVG